MEPNQRLCPKCSEIITHKCAKSARKATQDCRPCKRCHYVSRANPKEAKCPLCGYVSKRLTDFERHLTSEHGMTARELWDKEHNGPALCRCGCGGTTKWLGWNLGYSGLLVGHNANLVSVYGQEAAREISDKRRKKLTGRTGWAKGLTKSDPRIESRSKSISESRKAAFADGKIRSWSKGKSKETDERLSRLSKRHKERYASGELVPWAKGLSKESDQRIRNMAAKVSLTHQNLSIRKRLDELKRLKAHEIKERIESSGKLKLIESSLDEYVNDNTSNITVECITCGAQTVGSLRRFKHGRCHHCDPGGSAAQHEMASWIRSLGVGVESNKRDIINGLEVDIYVPEKKLGIEYNGLYWHSLLNKSASYHDNKTQACTKAGISLFHVFEDEWKEKRNIIESMIKHRIGLTENRVSARNCEIVVLSPKERFEFFTENHIDGDTQSKIAWGLVLDDKIVAAMSLRSPFHKKHNKSLEVARFCTRTHVSVVGALGKLTKQAFKFARSGGCESLMSYVDTRLGTSKSWDDSGWTFVEETHPRFWWTDFTHRFNRFKYKADPSRGLSEAQVAEEAGVVKIHGCKNRLYKITLDAI